MNTSGRGTATSNVILGCGVGMARVPTGQRDVLSSVVYKRV